MLQSESALTADMGSGRRTQLWLLAFLAFCSLAGVSALNVMSAPNVLRLGTAEKIFVECQDCTTGSDIMVTIKVMNHPTKSSRLAFTSVTLNQAGKFQGLGQITIPAGDFSKDPNIKQYVYLQAEFPDSNLEKVVLVSFQSGYIFIQTDKTLYTPNSNVNYRIFALTPSMQPVEKETATDTSIVTEIVNPDGIVLSLGQVILKSGIHSGVYKFSDIVSPGMWKVVAKFQNNLHQSFSAEFEVKEYVLPSFEVKLTSLSSFFQVDSKNFTVNIRAKYLFGEDVEGMAFVIFGVIHEGQKKSFPGSLQRVMIEEGNKEVTLKREHITETFPNIHDLVGSSIYIAVSVLTESGSEMVEAELRGIQIVTSPYTINFKRTPKYFKPGLPLNVVIEVVNPDGTLARGVPVMVDPDEHKGVTGANGMARLAVNTNDNAPLTITAKTNDPDLPHENQASATMTAQPYTTNSNSYIHIGVDASKVQLGESLRISLFLSRQQYAQSHVTYLILSKGQLVKYGKYQKRPVIYATVTITKEMLPSFRIIAYYHTNDNELVSDSLWVDAEDSCMGSLKLQSSRPTPSYAPRKLFGLQVTGDPGATVGLVAVDKGVYVLNNKHRLTQKKVWDLVEKHDTGCTPGGGKDNMNVLYDAGLLFVSNIAPGTPHRQELKCPAPSRRKRASSILEVRTSLVSQFEDQLQHDCCLDGMSDTPLSYSCERRSQYIEDGPDCVNAFLHCCRTLEMQRAERREDSLILARSEENDSDLDINEIVSRTQFPESWLWIEVKLPACPQQTPNCVTTLHEQNIPLKDSITTWELTGISLSRTHGICVGDPFEVIVRKEFFIDLRLPYSAVRGEQIEIKAVLHNYSPESITVRVDLLESEHVCSSASKRVKYRQEVNVGRQTTRSVSFVIIPMKEGELPIEVKGAVKGDSGLKDGIMKKLLVVPQGILRKSVKTLTVDPAKKGVGGNQLEIINSKIPDTDLVPNTPTRTLISVTGREQISALVENAISGKSMGTLIKQPSGCGEQNMITMTLPVIATVYLDKTSQWDTVGLEKREEALQHIKTGYHNELAYRKTDGSFAVFKNYDRGSTWLTAYVAKVFAMAYDLVDMQSSVICDAIEFLILTAQLPDGSFREVGTIIHGEMIGDVRGTNSDASLTAFCLIAMQESRKICTNTTSLTDRINKAVAYLEGRLYNLTNSYAAAMTSYALANENKLDQRILFKFISSDLTHWPVRDKHLFTLEATAYALLALVKAQAFEDVRPVVRWFNQQQIDGGGYGSTQATIMVYQAIAEYWSSANEEAYDVNVDIDFAGRTKIEKFNFNRKNHYTTRTSKLNSINQDVTVTATGTGEATVKMVSLYYALPKEKESDCNKFNLSVQLVQVKVDEDEKIYKLIIHVLYKDKDRDSTMTILDIGLLTGFTINTDDLNRLSKGRARTIARYEMDNVLSERGSLIIYLDKVSHTQSEEVAFRIHQKLKVGVLQPAAVSVYEYYDHQHNNQTPCVKFYSPERKRGELLRLCANDECTCAEENCSMQKKEKIQNEDRTAKACQTELHSKVDFVYKVRVENFTADLSTDIYTMLIEEVIKEGTYDDCQRKAGEVKKTCDVGPLGKLRTFLSYQHCRDALNLKTGKTYLIMGLAKDIHIDEEQSYRYILGERTWIEYWPSEDECQAKEHRPTCLGMEEMVQMYTIFGCPNK